MDHYVTCGRLLGCIGTIGAENELQPMASPCFVLGNSCVNLAARPLKQHLAKSCSRVQRHSIEKDAVIIHLCLGSSHSILFDQMRDYLLFVLMQC